MLQLEKVITNEERYLARVLFANRIYKANGFSFQQLFATIQRGVHGQAFVEVRPQGSLGDQGNDGFLPSDGHYFQVYGPIDPDDKVTTAADKLSEDFDKLKLGWAQVVPLRAYSFVFNDKYEGVFTRIAQALGQLQTANGLPCLPFTAAHLEETFLRLNSDQMQGVLSLMIPDPTRVTAVDYGALQEVVVHLMNSPAQAVATRWGDLPNVGDKIALNHLNDAWAALLKTVVDPDNWTAG